MVDVPQRKLYLIQLPQALPNDIEQATRLLRAIITQYGMSEKFGLMGLATQESVLKRKSSFKL